MGGFYCAMRVADLKEDEKHAVLHPSLIRNPHRASVPVCNQKTPVVGSSSLCSPKSGSRFGCIFKRRASAALFRKGLANKQPGN